MHMQHCADCRLRRNGLPGFQDVIRYLNSHTAASCELYYPQIALLFSIKELGKKLLNESSISIRTTVIIRVLSDSRRKREPESQKMTWRGIM